jgi:hypothetical protein
MARAVSSSVPKGPRWLTAIAIGVYLAMASAPRPLARQSAPDIAVVVHPDVQIDNLTRAELRRIVLGDREFWPSGVRVRVLIRAPIARERDAAVRGVCDMTEAQFRQHWIAKVFRAETGSGPRIVHSPQMALDQVGRIPGAITFLEAPISTRAVKVLRIDGKLPGQPGYTIR